MSDNDKFVIDISGSVTLTVKEIWPDGDAPENPTFQDVINVITTTTHDVGDLLTEWDLDQLLEAHVRSADLKEGMRVKWR